jgi:WD40 repeat protein
MDDILVGASVKGNVAIFDLKTSRLLGVYRGHHQDPVTTLCLSPNGVLMTGSSKGECKMWSTLDEMQRLGVLHGMAHALPQYPPQNNAAAFAFN